MQKVITVTVTSGAGRVNEKEKKEDRFVGEHEFELVNNALKEGFRVKEVIQTPGSNTGSLHPTVVITFVLEKS